MVAAECDTVVVTYWFRQWLGEGHGDFRSTA